MEIIGYIKEVSYGKVKIEVSDDAGDEEIRNAILEYANCGSAYYTSNDTEVLKWEKGG